MSNQTFTIATTSLTTSFITTTNNNNTTTDTDVVPVTSSTFFRVVFGVTLLFELVLSVWGGWFACKVITKNNLVWRTVWIYLFALAAWDVGMASTAIPLMLVATIYEDILKVRLFCNLSGALLVFFETMSVLTVAMISIHKYITISRPLQALRRKVYRDVIGYLLVSLSLAVFLSLAPVVGFGEYAYRVDHKMCLPHSDNSRNNRRYSSVIVFCSIFIPLIIIAMSTLATCRVENDRREIILDAFFSTPLTAESRVLEDEEIVVRTMTLIITSSLITWGPLFVYMVMSHLNVPTPLWYCHVAYLCMLLHGAVNPIIYFRHKNFSEDFKEYKRGFGAYLCSHGDGGEERSKAVEVRKDDIITELFYLNERKAAEAI